MQSHIINFKLLRTISTDRTLGLTYLNRNSYTEIEIQTNLNPLISPNFEFDQKLAIQTLSRPESDKENQTSQQF